MKAKKTQSIQEFSKFWVSVILTVLLIDFQFLIFMHNDTLAAIVVTDVFGVFGGYMVKAYLGKRNEEKNNLDLELEKMKQEKEFEQEQ